MKTIRILLLCFFSLFSALSANAQQQCEMPNMMFAIDRSNSMNDNDKWTQAKTAVDYILTNYGTSLRFGLDMYPSDNDCGAGNVQVDVGEGTASQILNMMNNSTYTPYGNTPTAATLMVLNQYRPLKDMDRRNFVIMVTDGCDTCAHDHAQDPVSSTADLYANGIRTYVIGFNSAGSDPGCSDWDAILTNMATEGHTGDYYIATSQSELQAAMNAIINESLQEICDDRDNNCNGQIDENWPDKNTLCTATQGGCVATGVYICNSTHDGLTCDAQFSITDEVCDGRDNDCDGQIDEGFADLDIDGYKNCVDCCDSGQENMTGCTPATAASIHPGAVEMCNGRDDNCNGAIDESDPQLGQPCGACGYAGHPACKGDCSPGANLCMNGSLACIGEITSQNEVCDHHDNDCDGQTDEGFVEICDDGIDNDCDGLVDAADPDCGGSCNPGEIQQCGPPDEEGACKFGTRLCNESGHWESCEGAIFPAAEVCDGLDNDCDGQTDEDAVPEVCDDGLDNDCDGFTDMSDPDCGDCTPGQSKACGKDVGECRQGVMTCTGQGRWTQCEGSVDPFEEACDGLDNDCDSITDEGNLCEGYDVCLCGNCASMCSASECPVGHTVCVNNWCVADPCCGVSCPADLECNVDGTCVDSCVVHNITCKSNEVCRMGACVPVDCYVPGNECDPGQMCISGACVVDPCYQKNCPANQYCREGQCQDIGCSNCRLDQICLSGQCQDSPCGGLRCEAGQICIQGECSADPCQGVYCPTGSTCVDGHCVADPCLHVQCPANSRCQEGYCVASGPEPEDGGIDGGDDGSAKPDGGDQAADQKPDAGADSGNLTDNGGGGGGESSCGCGAAGHSQGSMSLGLLLATLLIGRQLLRLGRGRNTLGKPF